MSEKSVINKMDSNSNTLLPNPSLDLLRVSGSPLTPEKKAIYNNQQALELYRLAVKNKIPMLYLETLQQQGKLSELEATYEEGKANYSIFIEGVATVSKVLEVAGVKFVIYKTIKPYPAVPNDIDILIMGDDNAYRHAAETLLRARYNVAQPGIIDVDALTDNEAYRKAARLATKPSGHKHEHISPTSTTFIAPGNKIVIDLRKELAANHTLWMDKNNFKEPITRTKLSSGEEINQLTPELELATIMMHSLKEQLYLLGDFYTLLFWLSKADERRMESLINIIKENRITAAARAFIAVSAALYQAAFGLIPEEVHMLSNKLGADATESENIVRNNFNTPHRYRLLTAAKVFLEKAKEGSFRRSALRQILSMLNPMQAKLVVSELIYMNRRDVY